MTYNSAAAGEIETARPTIPFVRTVPDPSREESVQAGRTPGTFDGRKKSAQNAGVKKLATFLVLFFWAIQWAVPTEFQENIANLLASFYKRRFVLADKRKAESAQNAGVKKQDNCLVIFV